MIAWLISKLPSWVVDILPCVVGVCGLIFIISLLSGFIDITEALVKYYETL